MRIIDPLLILYNCSWLAFADTRLVHRYECGGGVSTDVNSQLSYSSMFISAAQSLGKGLISITGSLTAALTRSPSNSPGVPMLGLSPDLVVDSPPGTSPSSLSSGNSLENHSQPLSIQTQQRQPGVVTVIHCSQFAAAQKRLPNAPSGLVAHFTAHVGSQLSHLQFSPNGSLLATADVLGRDFNIFRILSHPTSVSLAAVQHLYTLQRGDTTASVVEMSFSVDSRWLIVATHRGTGHVFPITPYGGPVTRRSHCQRKVPNRFSRFHQSAGLDSLAVPTPHHRHLNSGVNNASPRSNASPTVSGSPKLSSALHNIANSSSGSNAQTTVNQSSASALTFPSRLNARLPPYPHPVLVRPLYQIKQVLSIPGLDLVPTPGNSLPVSSASSPPASSINGATPASTLSLSSSASVSSAFSPCGLFRAPSQLYSAASMNSLNGSNGLSSSLGSNGCKTYSAPSPAASTLIVATWQGDLVEYRLSPRTASSVLPEKVSADSPIELEVEVVARWPLLSHFQAAGSIGGVPGPLYSYADANASCPCALVFDQEENIENCPTKPRVNNKTLSPDDWISQVETFTCQSPARRLWLGPQFSIVVGQTQQPQHSSSTSSDSPPRNNSDSDEQFTTSASISLSTSPKEIYQSEDSALGEIERAPSPPPPEPEPQPLPPVIEQTTSVEVTTGGKTGKKKKKRQQQQQQQQQQQKHQEQLEQQQQEQEQQKQQQQQSKETVEDEKKSGEDDKTVNPMEPMGTLATLEVFSSQLDHCASEGNVETELLAAAVKDLNCSE